MKTLIAIPCMDTMPTGFVQSLLHLEKGEGTSVLFKANTLVYDSRNLISMTAIEEGYDRVMWFDSDMMFTPATMRMLHKDLDGTDLMRPKEMVTGLYFRRRGPHTPVIFYKIAEPAFDESGKLVGQVEKYTEYPENTLFAVAGCGLGCCMTSVKLLKEVWDKFGPPFSPYPWAGEDISFCHRVNQLGYRIWCDSRITCGHIGQTVYTEEFYKACLKRGEKSESN